MRRKRVPRISAADLRRRGAALFPVPLNCDNNVCWKLFSAWRGEAPGQRPIKMEFHDITESPTEKRVTELLELFYPVHYKTGIAFEDAMRNGKLTRK